MFSRGMFRSLAWFHSVKWSLCVNDRVPTDRLFLVYTKARTLEISFPISYSCEHGGKEPFVLCLFSSLPVFTLKTHYSSMRNLLFFTYIESTQHSVYFFSFFYFRDIISQKYPFILPSNVLWNFQRIEILPSLQNCRIDWYIEIISLCSR